MNPPQNHPATIDNSFSTFMFGITLGVIGSLMLGTQEGRKITRQVLHSISTGIEENEDLFTEAKDIARNAFHEIESQFKTPPYLADQPPVSDEGAPPLPPLTNRPKPAPTYFHQNGEPMKP